MIRAEIRALREATSRGVIRFDLFMRHKPMRAWYAVKNFDACRLS
jgi:hypothetical protein